jgi:hypothetical protein
MVLEHGRVFTGIERPKGYRQWAMKQCFRNAATLALRDKGCYVEGFAISSSGSIYIHHAWITLDGVHSVDVTWRDAPSCHYFGIEFNKRFLASWFSKRQHCVLRDTSDENEYLILQNGIIRR